MTARVSFADQTKRLGLALGWIVIFAVIGVGITIVVSQLVPGWGGREWFLVRNGAYELIGCGTATLVVGRLLDKHSWDQLGWRTDGRLGRRLARGVGIGALPAMLILAVLFGLAHAKNDNATFFSTVNVALAAVWLSFAFFSTGGMALAWGLHFGWNAGLAILFDAPVSGYEFQVPVVEYTPGHQPWVDGGLFGPEAGIVTTIVLFAGTLAVIGARWKQPRTWLAG